MEFMPNTVVYPPNKRFDRKVELSQVPVMYDHLLFIDFNENGESIVGSCNLNGTLWEGTLLYFDNKEYMQRPQFSRSYIGSTIADGKFLNEETIVLAEDTGIINVLNASNEKKEITSINYFMLSDCIPKLAVWNNTTNLVACSGNSVSVWDVNSKSKNALHTFSDYHTQLVNDVDTIRKEPDVFLSSSMDRKCCLWDVRNESKPATVVYENEFSSLTTVASNQKNTNYIIVGTEGGNLYLIDRREPGDFVSVANCDFSIYRTTFDQSSKFAVCGDTNKVLVFDCEDEVFNNIHQNETHTGIVRGLAWHNDELYSCAFDKRIINHSF